MAGLTRQERREINSSLVELSNIDFKTTSLEDLKKQIDGILELFDLYEVCEESEYRKKLSAVIIGADEFYGTPKKILEPQFNKEKRNYFGKAERSLFRVMQVYDSLFLTRIYSKNLHLTWKFNRAGRLEFIETRIFPDGKPVPIMFSKEKHNKNGYDWNSKRFYCNQIPEGLNEINNSFSTQSLQGKYFSLVKYGHNTSVNLLDALENNKTRPPYCPSNTQKLLSELINDDDTLYILKQSSVLDPRVNNVSSNIYKVTY